MSHLTPSQFERISEIARERWGLHLTAKKMSLVSNRLSSFIRKSSFNTIDEYLSYLEDGGTDEDMLIFFDLLSTNVTSFFRDKAHFDYLEREFYTPLARGNLTTPGHKIRLWSAGCSTGCEPYSMAINACEHLSDVESWDVRVLATDLSNFAVQNARAGVYDKKQLENLPDEIVRRYFTKCPDDDQRMTVREALRRMIHVARLNLMDPWPMKGSFDVIFCRNVMIYFDSPTRLALVNRFYDMLRPGGVFAVGSAETLSGLNTKFRSVQASVYVK